MQTEEDPETFTPQKLGVSANTGRTQEAGVMLVACTATQSTLTNTTQVCFGKVGVRHHHVRRNPSFYPTVNVNKLWTWVSKQTQVNTARKKTRAAPITDVARSGYYKVLG